MMKNVKTAKEQIANNVITTQCIAMNVQMEGQHLLATAGEALFEIIKNNR